MAPCSMKSSAHLLRLGSLVILAMILLSAGMLAQEQTPKMDVFIGYQWLDPRGSVPVVGGQAQDVGGMPKGAGFAFAYNFNRSFAFEGDVGANFGKVAKNIETFSGGPRYTYRGEGANYFIHGLVGWNRMTDFLSVCLLYTSPSPRD